MFMSSLEKSDNSLQQPRSRRARCEQKARQNILQKILNFLVFQSSDSVDSYPFRARNFSTHAVAVGNSAGQQPMVVQNALLKWLSDE